MSKTVLSIGPIEIRWYSLFILIAILISYYLIIREAKKKKIDENFINDLIFYSLLFGILGARIYYVLFNIDYYLKRPLEIFQIWNGGLAIHGGLLFGLLFILYYCKKHEVKLLPLLDIIVVPLILSQAIGRWGNFFNQEAYGRIVSKSFLQNIHLPNWIINNMYIDGFYREPTFLYESFFSVLGFILLISLRKNKKIKVGQITGTYMIWYGIERLIIESFRSDSLMLGPLKIAQVVSIIFIVVGLYLVFNKKQKENYHNVEIYK